MDSEDIYIPHTPQKYFEIELDKEETITRVFDVSDDMTDSDRRLCMEKFSTLIHDLEERVTRHGNNHGRYRTAGCDLVRPYVLLNLGFRYHSKLYGSRLVIRKRDVYVVAFTSGQQYYELPESENRLDRKFARGDVVGSSENEKGKKIVLYECGVCASLSMGYVYNVSTVSVGQLLSAVIFFHENRMILSSKYHKAQVHLEYLMYTFAESTRFWSMFRAMRSCFMNTSIWYQTDLSQLNKLIVTLWKQSSSALKKSRSGNFESLKLLFSSNPGLGLKCSKDLLDTVRILSMDRRSF